MPPDGTSNARHAATLAGLRRSWESCPGRQCFIRQDTSPFGLCLTLGL